MPHETGQSNLPGHTEGRDNLDAREAQWQMSATTRDDWCMARVAGEMAGTRMRPDGVAEPGSKQWAKKL